MALEVTDVPVSGIYGPAARVPKKELGKDDFLLLLTKQLQNQDPMKPEDNMQFVAQMASFSTLEQITNMTKTLTNFITSSANQSKTQALSYLGLKVTALGTDPANPIIGTVTGVKFVDGEAMLQIGDNQVKASDVQSIEYPAASTA